MTNQAFDADELNLIELAQQYSDDDTARGLLERLRWPNGPVCPHCKATEPYVITPKSTSKRPARKGLYKCKNKDCRKQFTVTVGTIFEDSHLPIGKWLMAIFILCSSKKGMSAHQLHRMLKVTYKSAWFMTHRIRYAMEPSQPLGAMLKGTCEVDKTYVGGKPRYGENRPQPGTTYRKDSKKVPVVALIERNGDVRTQVVANVTANNIRQFVNDNIDRSATVNTDQLLMYRTMFRGFDRHDAVDHGRKEYARTNADRTVSHVNTCESFFSLLKRGVYGSWHHVSKEHLPKYCGEFAFRWNNRKDSDGKRMVKAVTLTEGKRLTYKQPTGNK